MPRPDELSAYELVLGDAMAGDTTIFARQDYVEEAWRIVDAILDVETPVRGLRTEHVGPDVGRSGDRARRTAGGRIRPEPA